MRRITAAMLRRAGACEDPVRIFAAEWPHGASVTLNNARRAAELGLDIGWAAGHLMSAPAWGAYGAAIIAAYVAYRAATAQAYKAADAAIAPALEVYRVAKAQAFVSAWAMMEEDQ